jgi:hypothetical protein
MGKMSRDEEFDYSLMERLRRTKPGSKARQKLLDKMSKFDLGFKEWWRLHAYDRDEFSGFEDFEKLLFENAVKKTDCMYEWLILAKWAIHEHPEFREIVFSNEQVPLAVESHDDLVNLMNLLLLEREYASECGSSDSKIIESIESKIDTAISGLEQGVSYPIWIEYFHSDCDDSFLKLYFHKLSNLLIGDLEQWWTARDMADCVPWLRSFALQKMKEIKDLEPWREIFDEVSFDLDDKELYVAAVEILSEIDPDFGNY